MNIASKSYTQARLHAVTVLSNSVMDELKSMATGLNSYSDAPKANALSPGFSKLFRATSFAGFWGIASFLGGLRELALRIESVPPASVDREEYGNRVKTLAGGLNVLGLHLKALAAGHVVSYRELSEHFAKVMRKARPALLELDAGLAAQVFFMAVPPSLEVEAYWVPAAGAAHEALVAALAACIASELSAGSVSALADANPYPSLSGLLEGAASMPGAFAKGDLKTSMVDELQRLHDLLAKEPPFVPPAPDSFLFSRMLYLIASEPRGDVAVDEIRKRYSLMKPGSDAASMQDLAKKYFESMKRLVELYKQAMVTKTPSLVQQMAAKISSEAFKLNSSAFTTLAKSFVELTNDWTEATVTEEDWMHGAAHVFLMREAAETWGNPRAQEDLASLADQMEATRLIPACLTMQETVRATAVRAVCSTLLQETAEINKGIEKVVGSFPTAELEHDQAQHVVKVVGERLVKHLRTVAGIMKCMCLPEASGFAERLVAEVGQVDCWANSAPRAGLFRKLSTLNLFIQRLRPGSLIDMDSEDVGGEAFEGLHLLPATPAEVPVSRVEDMSQPLDAAPAALAGDASSAALNVVELVANQAPLVEDTPAEKPDEVPPMVEKQDTEVVDQTQDYSALTTQAAPAEAVAVAVATDIAFNSVPLDGTASNNETSEAAGFSPHAEVGSFAPIHDDLGGEVFDENLSFDPSDIGDHEAEVAVPAFEVGGQPELTDSALEEPIKRAQEAEIQLDADVQGVSTVVATEYVDPFAMLDDVMAAAEGGSPDEPVQPLSAPSPETLGGFDFDFLASASAAAVSLDVDELRSEFLDAQEGRENSLDHADGELLTIMFEESWECLAGIDAALEAAASRSSRLGESVPEARRHIHTLKGVSRTCGLHASGAILHAMEDRLDVMPEDGDQFSGVVDAFRDGMEVVRVHLERARSWFHGGRVGPMNEPVEAAPSALVSAEDPPAEVIVAAAELVAEPSDALAAELVVESPMNQVQVEDKATKVEGDFVPGEAILDESAGDALESSGQQPAAVMIEAVVVPQAAPAVTLAAPAAVPAAASAASTVRIPVALANRVGNATGQVLTASRQALEDSAATARALRELDENLKRMAPALRELEMMAAASVASSQAVGVAQGFDPLELDRYTQIQEVATRLAEAFQDVVGSSQVLSEALDVSIRTEESRAELSDELQRGSSELLLVPLASQTQRLQLVLARACTDAGKKAQLVIEAGARVPAAAVDKLGPVFDHILRNAVAHGIETPEARAAAGKSEIGQVVISVPKDDSAQGGVIRVSVRDDGAGIDLERVRAIAIARGLIAATAQLSADATRELLFMPGFSTAGKVSELAGRGVGLDVVRMAISSLGGVVTVNSAPGRGTEFVLTLSTDSASMSVVPVSAGGFKCLLPLPLIRRIVPVSTGAEVVVDAALGKATIAGVEYELIEMARRVPATGDVASRSGRGHLVLMAQSNVVKAVLVDSVGQQTRVVVKPLGPFVRDIPGFIAGTTMTTGAAGLVVNPLQLAEVSAKRVEKVSPSAQSVMLVDDSSTVRLMTSRFLKRIGYAVHIARDGLEALELLNKGVAPDFFLFDLEMPRMTGFELIGEVRRKPAFAATPIVVITSRSAEKHRDAAVKAGATRFLPKPCDEAELQRVLAQLSAVAA